MELSEKSKIWKRKYNNSEKGKAANAAYQRRKRQEDPLFCQKQKLLSWKTRGLKYYPNDILNQLTKEQICCYCNKELKKNVMEHNHKTGTFRGWSCSSCNTYKGVNDAKINLCMNELKLIFKLPKVFNKLYNI